MPVLGIVVPGTCMSCPQCGRRRQSSGEPGRIHAGACMYRVLRHAFPFEARGLVEIKGKGLLTAYFLLGPRPSADPAQGA